MLKLIGACSPLLLAVTVAATTVQGQTTGNPEPQQQITAIGCVVRNGTVDVNKGTRRLNMDPNGLALTGAQIVRSGNARGSAVPGSQPDGTNSGTIPRGTIVTGQTASADTSAFALSGDQLTALGEQVGRRVEVVGRITPAETSADAARGTTGSARDATPVAGAGTREERAGEGLAHPSTELQKLEVVSFRPATGACQ